MVALMTIAHIQAVFLPAVFMLIVTMFAFPPVWVILQSLPYRLFLSIFLSGTPFPTFFL